MTIRYFEKVKKRIAKLGWLIDREGNGLDRKKKP